MHGLHLTADLRECQAHQSVMTDGAVLREICLGAVRAAGLSAVGELFHSFARTGAAGEPAGVTGVVLLAESHVAVHTWPEIGCVTLDVYVCNVRGDHCGAAQMLLAALIEAFAPMSIDRGMLQRGPLPGAASMPR